MRYIVLALLVVAAFAAGAGRSVFANGPAAATPVEAVRILVSGGTPQGPVRSGCEPTRRTYQTCPVTDRFLRRLERLSQAAFGEPISRGSGQDLSPRVRVTEIENTGEVALVNALFEPAPPEYIITYVVRGQRGQWLVDDSYCAGRPETTIYASPIPILPCGVSPAAMPNTAGNSVLTYAWLLAVSGLVVFGTGLAMKRRSFS